MHDEFREPCRINLKYICFRIVLAIYLAIILWPFVFSTRTTNKNKKNAFIVFKKLQWTRSNEVVDLLSYTVNQLALLALFCNALYLFLTLSVGLIVLSLADESNKAQVNYLIKSCHLHDSTWLDSTRLDSNLALNVARGAQG